MYTLTSFANTMLEMKLNISAIDIDLIFTEIFPYNNSNLQDYYTIENDYQ